MGKTGLCCSFCGKAQEDVGKLVIAGKMANAARICDECIALCVDIVGSPNGHDAVASDLPDVDIRWPFFRFEPLTVQDLSAPDLADRFESLPEPSPTFRRKPEGGPHLLGRTYRRRHQEVKLVGVEVVLVGDGEVVLYDVRVEKGSNLLHAPWTVLGVAGWRREILRNLRDLPVFHPAFAGEVTLSISGAVRANVNLLVNRHRDDEYGPGFPVPGGAR